MSNNPVTESLKNVLADSYSLYLKTHSYHWNVTGKQFFGLHQMFMAEYTELWNAIDVIAERIVALGDKAPGSYAAYTKRSTITDGDENKESKDMVKELQEDNLKLVKTLKKAAEAAQKAGDGVTEGIMYDRIEIHEKNAWMLKATLD
jgi:starvation-inducible DNA-binding protein